MKRTFIAALAATVPVAALAIGSAMAQPPKATTENLVSFAALAGTGAPRPKSIHIVSPITITVWAKLAPSGMPAATSHEAANLLDS